MRAINIDKLEWFRVKFQGRDEYCILIRKPHINDLDWFEAEPVRHGRWVRAHGMMPPEFFGKHKCSLCGHFALSRQIGREELSNYCPNCGAKMDLKE